MKSRRNLHYIPQAYLRRFANEKDQIAYVHSGSPVVVTNVRNTFSCKESGIPLFNERAVTDTETEAMRLFDHLDSTDEEQLTEHLRVLSDRPSGALYLPSWTDYFEALCRFSVLQTTRTPKWQASYSQMLRENGQTHREYCDALKKGDPYARFSQMLSDQYGLSVVVSSRAEFVVGSQFMTYMSNGDFVIPVGRNRAVLLRKDKRFTVKQVLPNIVAQYNKQILVNAESCGTHPDNRGLLDRLAHRVGKRQKPLELTTIP